ncbi:MAG: hypothetical protein ACP5G4_02815 [bacterium]
MSKKIIPLIPFSVIILVSFASFNLSGADHCRSCNLKINNDLPLNTEIFLADTFMNLSGDHVPILNYLEFPFVLFVIRNGDRPAWIQTTLAYASEFSRDSTHYNLGFVFLDMDSLLCAQMKSTLEFYGYGNFFALYTESYTESPKNPYILRWQMQVTPVIIVGPGSGEIRSFYIPGLLKEQSK